MNAYTHSCAERGRTHTHKRSLWSAAAVFVFVFVSAYFIWARLFPRTKFVSKEKVRVKAERGEGESLQVRAGKGKDLS